MARIRTLVPLLVGAIAVAGLAGCGPEAPAVLRFDGLYRAGPTTSTRGTTYWRYLRFYEDGTALSASSTEDTAQVAAWLTRPYEGQGTWTREVDRITFSAQVAGGHIDYEGEVLPDGLRLRYHSHVHDGEGESVYEFVPLPSPPGVR